MKLLPGQPTYKDSDGDDISSYSLLRNATANPTIIQHIVNAFAPFPYSNKDNMYHQSKSIIKWHLDDEPSHGSQHQDFLYLDIKDAGFLEGPTGYKTGGGNLAILKHVGNKCGFTYFEYIVGNLHKEKLSFTGNTPFESIVNALNKGRHVYTFSTAKDMLNKHGLMAISGDYDCPLPVYKVPVGANNITTGDEEYPDL